MEELGERASRGCSEERSAADSSAFPSHTVSRMAAWDYELTPYLTRIGSTHSWLNSTLVYPALCVSPRGGS